MRNLPYWLAALLLPLLILGTGTAARAQEFQPDLGQAREIIASKDVTRTPIPDGAKELTVYPLPAEHPRQLLTAIPGQPFYPVMPMPLGRAWWKYPIYGVLGLPRDLIDAAFGGFSQVPVLNIPIVMGGYELLPTQLLMRDPRDWHKWPGLQMNARNHGPIDGDSWGWFPNLHAWNFTYPSQRLARKNQILNQELKQRLDAENRRIEESNAAIEIRLRDARTKALAAIEAGNGTEAANRMIAYRHNYPLDEGGFALFATALALYLPLGPDWTGPVLWSDLEFAQPRLLAEAEKLLDKTAQKHPDRRELSETLIYTRLVLGRTGDALEAAEALLKAKPGDPYRQRLVFETALSARNLNRAREIRAAMAPNSYDEPTRTLMDLRLQMLAGEPGAAVTQLTAMQSKQPEDAYLAYLLACARMLQAQKLENPADAYKQAAAMMSLAGDRAPGPALRLRAERASTWLQSVVSGIASKPELFSDNAAAAAAAATTTKPADTEAESAPATDQKPSAEKAPKSSSKGGKKKRGGKLPGLGGL